MADLMAARRRVMLSSPVLKTATGNPVTFRSGFTLPVEAMSVDIPIVQSGSGTPSPTNIRPISTFQSVAISHGASAENPTVYTVQFGRTICAGTLDVKTGVLTVEWGLMRIGDYTWVYDASYTRFATQIADIKKYALIRATPLYASCFEPISDNRSIGAVPNNGVYCGLNSLWIYIKTSAYTDPTSFRTAYANQVIAYPINATATYQLDPVTINTLRRENRIASDSGTITISYWS